MNLVAFFGITIGMVVLAAIAVFGTIAGLVQLYESMKVYAVERVTPGSVDKWEMKEANGGTVSGFMGLVLGIPLIILSVDMIIGMVEIAF